MEIYTKQNEHRMKTPGLTLKELAVLGEARAAYGCGRQISVCCEELCELASILNKYIRYDTDEKAVSELYPKVLEELADVYVVLNHVRSIFHLQDAEVEAVIDSKLERMERWLRDSHSMEQTTIDRTVNTAKYDRNLETCKTCYWWEHISEEGCPCCFCNGTPQPPKLIPKQELKPKAKG